MNYILDGLVDDTQLIKYIQLRPMEDLAAFELLGYHDSIWKHRKFAEFGTPDLDIAGTGGVRRPRYNVSTSASFVLSALGVKVAKHGNRGSKESNGSFDFLESLGFSLDTLTQNAVTNLDEFGLTFLFARDWHPVLARVAPVRKEIGSPTFFNLLGPLLNPASPTCQIVGCIDESVGKILAEAIGSLRNRAQIVTSLDGYDEVSIFANTKVINVVEGKLSHWEFEPFDDIRLSHSTAFWGGCNRNASEFLAVLKGNGSEEIRKMIAVNAAFGLLITDNEKDPVEAYKKTYRSLKDGLVLDFFTRFAKGVV